MFVQIGKRNVVRLDQINNVYSTPAGTVYITLSGEPKQGEFLVENPFVENLLFGLTNNAGLYSQDNTTLQSIFDMEERK